MNKLEVKTF